MRKIISRNPFNGKINREYENMTDQHLIQVIKKSQEGFQINRTRRIQERADIIGNIAQVMQKNSKTLAEAITQQMGKPIKQANGEVEKAISFCRHFSKNYNDILPVRIKTDAKVKTLVKYDPLGTIYQIVPFNFPLFLIFKGCLTNFLLGNAVITKTADSTPFVGELAQKCIKQAGFDAGQFQNVLTTHSQLDLILSQQQVMGIVFTGSSKAGSIIAETAGKHLKKSVLELGGNDPFVVLQDADVQLAINDAVQFRCNNAGQICFSPKRFIIVKEHYNKFRDSIIEKFKKIKYGNPMDVTTEMGPLARDDLHDNLTSQLKDMPKSWKIFWQREDVSKPFFPITVLQASDNEFYDEQLFGPVFTLFQAKNQKHAIQIANRGTYGLGSSVYSKNNGEQVIQQIRSGMCFVNSTSKSMVNFPSGGVGKSGYGRQCGVQGMREFANARVYYVN